MPIFHEKPSFLLEKLTHWPNTLERPVAARALFLKALQESNPDADIGEELLKLSDSVEPMERIWANKTLAMLDLATQAHAAAELEGKEREEATNRLRTLCGWHDYMSGCRSHYSSSEEINFFGQDFTWAVEEAVNWLEELGNEENARTVAK